MHCSNCGKQINNVQFCPFCGSPNSFYQVPHPATPTEESVTARLISLSLAGDKQASSDLISYVYQDMYNTALAVCHSPADADDAVQNSCIKILSNLASLQNPDAFRPWCKSIVRKETLDILGKNYRTKEVFFTNMENQEDGLVYDPEDERIGYRPDLQMDNQARQEIIMDILDSLPEDQRVVAMMYFYDSMKMKEIAAELGVEESTIVGRLQRAKKSIKSSVTAMQTRDDIKLYNMAPLPFFIYLLSTWKYTAIESGKQAINQSALRIFGTAVSGSTPVAAYVAGTAAARSSAAVSYGTAGVRSASTIASTGNYGAGTAYSASAGMPAGSTVGSASVQNMSSGISSYPPAGTAASQGYYSAPNGAAPASQQMYQTAYNTGSSPASFNTPPVNSMNSAPNSAMPASQQMYQTAYNTGSSPASFNTTPVNPMNMAANAERIGAVGGAAATAGTAAAGAASSQAAASALAGTAAAGTAKAAAGKGILRALAILGLIGGTGTAGYYVISNDIVHVPFISDIVSKTQQDPSSTIERAEKALNEFDYSSFSKELEPGSFDSYRTSDSAALAMLRGFTVLSGASGDVFDFNVINTEMIDDTHCTITASLSYNPQSNIGTYDHTYSIPMVLHDDGKWYIIYNEVADENGVYAGFHFVN